MHKIRIENPVYPVHRRSILGGKQFALWEDDAPAEPGRKQLGRSLATSVDFQTQLAIRDSSQAGSERFFRHPTT
jgi:hypothetical protein